MEMEEDYPCDFLFHYLNLEDISPETELYIDSRDLLNFSLRKPKAEVNRDNVLDRPPCMEQDEHDVACPVNDKYYALITTEPNVKVLFLGLKKEYEKVQSRVNRKSRQRLTEGKVRIMVKADAQIAQIEVHVERTAMATALCGDVTGKVPLCVKMGSQVGDKQYLSVDLDSVYMSSNGTPVYKLSTVDADRRNRFRLVVTIHFLDGGHSRSFASPPFLLRSRRPERKKSV